MKKASVLIIAFLFPVLIAILFKFFSVSHFELRVLFQEEVPHIAECGEISVPYSIDKNLNFLNSDNQKILPFIADKLKVISFMKERGCGSLITEMNMIGDSFYGMDEIDIFLFVDSLARLEGIVPLSENIVVLEESATQMAQLKKCVFLMNTENGDNALLIDGINRIRGFYNLYKVEEVDSLIIETKILLREKELKK